MLTKEELRKLISVLVEVMENKPDDELLEIADKLVILKNEMEEENEM